MCIRDRFSTAQLKDRVVSLFVNRSSDAMALTVTSFEMCIRDR